MFLLFAREILENLAAARVLRDARRAAVELEAAALGGNRDAQRVAREEQVGVALRTCCAPGPALLAGAVDLHDALRRGEVARGRHFLHDALDVRAEELERPMTGLADQVEVARMAIGVLEAEPALAEVDLAGDAGVHHPLQRAVDGGAADAVIFASDEIDEIVGAQVPFLAQEHVDDLLPLAGAFAARRLQSRDIR